MLEFNMWRPPVKIKKIVKWQIFDDMSAWPTLNCFLKKLGGGRKKCNIVLERAVAEHLFCVGIKDVGPPSEEKKNHKIYKNFITCLPGQL